MTVQQCVCGYVIDHEDCACSLRDSECIRIDGSGSPLNPYHPEPIFDGDEDNLMTCGSDGLLVELPVWLRNPDRCQVYHSANQSTSHNIGYVVQFDSERYDSVSANPMHSTSTDNERVYIRTAGIYIITFVGAFAANGTGGRQILIRKNGKEFIAGVHRGATSASFETGLSVTTQEWLEAGEFLTVDAKQSSGGALNLLGGVRYSPIFTVHLRRLSPE